jgi:hypothetical protein
MVSVVKHTFRISVLTNIRTDTFTRVTSLQRIWNDDFSLWMVDRKDKTRCAADDLVGHASHQQLHSETFRTARNNSQPILRTFI